MHNGLLYAKSVNEAAKSLGHPKQKGKKVNVPWHHLLKQEKTNQGIIVHSL